MHLGLVQRALVSAARVHRIHQALVRASCFLLLLLYLVPVSARMYTNTRVVGRCHRLHAKPIVHACIELHITASGCECVANTTLNLNAITRSRQVISYPTGQEREWSCPGDTNEKVGDSKEPPLAATHIFGTHR